MSNCENITVSSWIGWVHIYLASERNLVRNKESNEFCDRVFENEINRCVCKTRTNYNKLMYREAFYSGFVTLQVAFERYKELSIGGLNGDLMIKYIEVQALLLAPLYPAISEYVWTLLHKPKLIMYAEWPSSGEVDHLLTVASKFVFNTIDRFQKQQKAMFESKTRQKCSTAFEHCVIFVENFYSPWQKIVLQNVEYQRKENPQVNYKELTRALKQLSPLKKHSKKVQPFVMFLKELSDTIEMNKAFSFTPPIDQLSILQQNSAFFAHKLKVQSLDLQALGQMEMMEDCEPFLPACKFISKV